MIQIFSYSALSYMEFKYQKTLTTTKLGFSGHVYRLITGSTVDVTAVVCNYILDTVKVPSRALPSGSREAGRDWPPHREPEDCSSHTLLHASLSGGWGEGRIIYHGVTQAIFYVFDVNHGQMQLGTIFQNLKSLTMKETNEPCL